MVSFIVHAPQLLILTFTEIIDFGYPQNSEIDTLKTYITTESIMSTATAIVRALTADHFRRR